MIKGILNYFSSLNTAGQALFVVGVLLIITFIVLLIIVSEETGIISLAINGRLTRNYDRDRLKIILLKIMEERENKRVKTAGKKVKGWITGKLSKK